MSARFTPAELAAIKARRDARITAHLTAQLTLVAEADEIGPCAGCHTLIIRYGARSTGTLCPACSAALPSRRAASTGESAR